MIKKTKKPLIKRHGIMFILSSPSGAGKSTIAGNLLQEKDLELSLSVSMTTRKPRPSEKDGVDYHFISVEEFKDCRDRNFFLEWAKVHSNFYGTPLNTVQQTLKKGQDMIFDIDWQGAAQIRKKIASDVVSLFILPPSLKELEKRLQRRSENLDSDIAQRLKNSRLEITHWSDYDYVLINDDLASTHSSVRSIILAERFRRSRLSGLVDFVDSLLSERD